MYKPDHVGDLLREFYKVFGRTNEGPPAGINVSDLFDSQPVKQSELDILQRALDDKTLRKQFITCNSIVEELAERLTSEELLSELSNITVSSESVEKLSTGVFWLALVNSLDKREEGLPKTPFDDILELPLPLKIEMTVQGSLVLGLYIALVYMREGALSTVISESASKGAKCSGQVQKLLHCDYIRRIRNALSHGSFSMTLAGIAFSDDHGVIVATPEFLRWLSTWIMLIQLQALAAVSNDHDPNS